MTDNDIIKRVERLSEEDPDGFSSDILNYINSLKATIQQLQLSTMVCEQRELIIENSKLITLNWGNPLVVAIKSEAIREFAEELTDRIVHNDEIVNHDSWVITSVINDLVKEITESEKIKDD